MLSQIQTRLSKGHTGQYLANKLSDCLKDFGISNKVCCHSGIYLTVTSALMASTCMSATQILGQVLDNTSNNDTMLAELETSMEGTHGVHTQICCICHVFNLAVKVRL